MKTSFSFEICQGITSLRSVIPWRSRGSLAVRRWRRSQARTAYIGAKVTVEQKQYIRRLAAECGMTVSSYVLARAFNYRPKARLTARQEAVMETLIGCRSDLVNYTSALRGMNPEKRRQMFNSYPFMLEWLKELGRLAERVTDVLDKVRFSNRLPDGTRNGEDREDEP